MEGPVIRNLRRYDWGGGGSVLQGVGSPQSVTPCRLLVGVAVLPGAAPGVDGVFDGFLLLVTSRRKSAKTYHINMDNMDIYIYIKTHLAPRKKIV